MTTFGSYVKGNSIIHKFDPRLKLFAIIALIVAVFLNTGFVGYLILTSWLIISIFLTRISVKMFLRNFRPVIFILIILFIINCFVIKGDNIGEILSITKDYPIFVISQKSIYESLYITFRIFLMINITTLLTATVKPLHLTLAIEDLLFPLKLIKVPVAIISTIISISFRMIPTLLQESQRIKKAQSSRGVDYKNGKITEKIKSSISLIIPLLVSSFQKAEDLSYAMDARGYNAYAKRTRFHKFSINFMDIILFLFFISVAIIIYIMYNVPTFIPRFSIDQYLNI